MQYREGLLRISGKGIGYVYDQLEGKKGEAIEIDPNFLNTGLHGDRVKVLLHPKVENEAPTGEIVQVLERRRLEFVGVLDRENGFYYLVPDDRRLYKDILIAEHKLAGGKAGDKVLARITEWRDPKKDPLGEVLIVIGPPGEHDVEMRAIVYEKGFRPDFPRAVEREAEAVKKQSAEDLAEEIKKRRDCRGLATFTIDPADAKDFDDALSLEKLPGGRFNIGVHIADVSHYLTPGGKLDEEARRRATSIYLVDRTIPMLPEILSNDLCSLNPGEDKLTFSAIFTFDADWRPVDQWFGRTVIHSKKRFSYEDAQEILDRGAGEHYQTLKTLNELAGKLRRERFAAGAISFERDEIKFLLDSGGRPLEVYKKARTDTHLLVEDLMLLANRRVAEFVSRLVRDAPSRFVYRVHDLPDQEKLQQLADFIAPLGYRLPLGSEQTKQRDINALLERSRGTPEEVMIHTAAMRAMAKAAYDMKNIGHYGLAFRHYTHFTSPIRRYPDVMVHRLLDLYLRGKKPAPEMLKDYERLSLHASQMELQAQEAERDSIKYKQVEYLSGRVGEVFDGVISGLAKWGIFVQEEKTLAEGMVRLFDLNDDYYVFDEKQYSMIGQKTGRRFRLGDRVRIKLGRAELKEKALDFSFV